ncbi:TolC family protein [Candidatus Latescibacterota bacterium]
MLVAMGPGPSLAADASPEPVALDLERCISIALESNERGRISRLAVEIAEAQRRQARSAYWPQLSLRSAFTRRDDDPYFVFPEETDSYRISGVMPTPIEAEVTVPEKRAKLLDRTHFATDLDLQYPLYMGGRRSALVAQAEAGIEAARQSLKRSQLEVIRDTKRHYYVAILSGNLLRLAQDALARLEVTLLLTESLYKTSTGRVTKTDYLEHKVVVESLRSMVARLRGDERVARAAVVYSIGLPWNTELTLTQGAIPFDPIEAELGDLVDASYRLNPDWGRLMAGLAAAEARIQEARSGHLPRVAAIANLEYLANSYDSGVVEPGEDRSWIVGIGLEWPLFTGFRTQNQVREARARLETLRSQQILLREGLALQIRHLLSVVSRSQQQEAAASAALAAATENRKLNMRAYDAGLAEVAEVVRAQIVESVTAAQYESIRYEHGEARANLEFVVGSELSRLLTGGEG